MNELIQGYWSKIGLNVKLNPIDFTALRAMDNSQSYPGPIDVGVWGPVPRPSMVAQILRNVSRRS